MIDTGIKDYFSYNAIIYTDGSANPNPGIIGSCSVGYIFKKDNYIDYSNDFLVDDHLFSDKGYISLSDYNKDKDNIKLVYPEYLFEVRNSFFHNLTNNYAEVYAFYSIIDYLVKNQYYFSSILVYSDSTYVVSTVMERLQEWKKNGWKKVDGKPVAEQDLWMKVSEALDVLESNGVIINLEWVKGHSGNLGNELANFGANVARIDSQRNYYDNFVSYVKGEDYFNRKIDIHPLLCFNNIIVNLSKEQKYYCLYHTDLPDNLVGKLSRISSYAVLMLKEPIDVIDNILNVLNRMKSYDSINFIKVDKIKNSKYYPRLKYFPSTSLITKKLSNTLVLYGGEVISPEINPPGLLINALETYDKLIDILTVNKDYDQKVDDTIDITDYFYSIELDKKNKEKVAFNKNLGVGNNKIELTIALPKISKSVVIPILLGIDMPERNILKKLESYSPKISLLIRHTSNQSFEYFFLIETNDSISIWHNKASSRIILLRE